MLKMRVHKAFPGVWALDGVGLQAWGGEVLAPMGENGADESTLMRILSGAYRADPGGEILTCRRPAAITDPSWPSDSESPWPTSAAAWPKSAGWRTAAPCRGTAAASDAGPRRAERRSPRARWRRWSGATCRASTPRPTIRTDLRGGEHHWLNFRRGPRGDPPGAESVLLGAGRVTVTPLRFERADEAGFAALARVLGQAGEGMASARSGAVG